MLINADKNIIAHEPGFVNEKNSNENCNILRMRLFSGMLFRRRRRKTP